MPGWIIVLLVFIVVFVTFVAVCLLDDENSRGFNKRVSKALQWWSQTDERLAETGVQTLKLLISEVDDLLKYPESMFYETTNRLKDLRHRLKRAKDGL